MCCWLELEWKAEHNTPVPHGVCALSLHQAASVRPRPHFQLNCVELQSCARCSLTPLQQKQAPTESSVQDRPHRNAVTPTSCPSSLPHPHTSSRISWRTPATPQFHPFHLVRQGKEHSWWWVSPHRNSTAVPGAPGSDRKCWAKALLGAGSSVLNSQERENLLDHSSLNSLHLICTEEVRNVHSVKIQRKFFLLYCLTGFHFINISRKQISDKVKFSTSLNVCISKYKALLFFFLHSKFTASIFN